MVEENEERSIRELLKNGWLSYGKVVEIAQNNPRKYDELLETLKDNDPTVRKFAAQSLGELENPQAVDALIDTLNDPDTDVKDAAAFALGLIGDASAAVSKLIQMLQDEESTAKASAAFALGQIGDPQAFDSLIHVLADKDSEVRSAAAESLGFIDDERAIPVILNLIKTEKNGGILMSAYFTLGRLTAHKLVKGAESATEKLEKLKGEVDVSATVSVKISEIIDPLKEDLEKYKEEIQTFKDTVESLESRYEKTHKAADRVLTLPDDDVRSLTVYNLLNRRIDDTLGATERHINKMYRTITIIVIILGVATVLAALLDKIVAIFG